MYGREERSHDLDKGCKSSRVAIKLLCSILVRKGNSLTASLLSSVQRHHHAVGMFFFLLFAQNQDSCQHALYCEVKALKCYDSKLM